MRNERLNAVEMMDASDDPTVASKFEPQMVLLTPIIAHIAQIAQIPQIAQIAQIDQIALICRLPRLLKYHRSLMGEIDLSSRCGCTAK